MTSSCHALLTETARGQGEAVLLLRESSTPARRQDCQAKAEGLGVRVWREYIEPRHVDTIRERLIAFKKTMAAKMGITLISATENVADTMHQILAIFAEPEFGDSRGAE